MKVLIVGGGLAGLTCARLLLRSGVDTLLLEASDEVGGRVRTDRVDGFVLDRGFQVLFTAYPAVRRQLELGRLRLRTLEPGAIIAKGTRRYVLTDPLRDPRNGINAALSPVVTPADKLRTLVLALRLRGQTVDQVISGQDMTTERFLKRNGFSSAYINDFIRPFYGGIFLDRSLQTSAKCFKFDFKMLAEGRTAVPAEGMSAIAVQLAEEPVARGRVRLGARVESLLRGENGEITGVKLADGTSLDAGAVVLSVPAPEAARLSGLPMPGGYVGTVNLYWAGSRPVYSGKKIVLNANRPTFVNNAVQITNATPEYAPPGRHLLSATVLGVPSGNDQALFARAMEDLRTMFRGDHAALSALSGYVPLKLYRIPYAQFAQPPSIHPNLPDNLSGIKGLYFAAEFTEASSLNAAMISGEKAANLLLGPR